MAKPRPYSFAAVVRRVVLDNVTVSAWGANPEEARDRAKVFLSTFPEPTDGEGVDYAFIDNRENLDAEVLELELSRK